MVPWVATTPIRFVDWENTDTGFYIYTGPATTSGNTQTAVAVLGDYDRFGLGGVKSDDVCT